MALILLVPDDPAWALDFARESDRLTQALGNLLLDLQHIGSTSVPNLLAKAVIDMLATVQNVEDLDARSEAFESLGYQVMGEFGIPGRRYFRKDDSNGRRTHQVHAFAKGSSEITRHLDFRDYLRAHTDVADAYAALKKMLALECLGDMSCYSDGKTAFIRDVERRAAIWKRDLLQ